MKSKARLDIVLIVHYGLIFTVCFTLCLLLHQIFQTLLLNGDSGSWYLIAKKFLESDISISSATRPIIYPLILGIVTKISNNHQACLLIFQSMIFCSNFLVLFWFLQIFIKSNVRRLFFVLLFALIQISYFSHFVYVNTLSPEILFSSTMYSGCLLIIGSSIQKKMVEFFIGFFVLGIAIATKPIGIVIMPVWLIYGFMMSFNSFSG